MSWRLCEYFEMKPHRWDRPYIMTPMIEEQSITVKDWEKDNPQSVFSMKKPLAFVDAETWRDFNNPVFFGVVIVEKVGPKREGITGGAFILNKDGKRMKDSSGKYLWKPTPDKWKSVWERCDKHTKTKNGKVMTKCDECVKVSIKPKNIGNYWSKADESKARVRITRAWCWADEVKTVLFPLLMERGVKKVYAHNATVDIIALLSSAEPQLNHPLEYFVQHSENDRSRILFKGASILTCTFDLAPYYNEQHSKPYQRAAWCYKDKKVVTKYDYPLEIIDSLGLLPMSLAKIGQAIGLEKGETPAKFCDEDHEDFGNIMSITMSDIDYCLNDCDVLWQGIQSFFKVAKEVGYHGTTLPLTVGTLGAQMIAHDNVTSDYKPKLYVKKENSWKYKTIVGNPELDDICRKAMVGGRTQVFVNTPVTVKSFGIDANSMYSAQQTNEANSFPDFRAMKLCEKPAEMTDEVFAKAEGCVYVEWERPNHDQIGLLPHRNEDNSLDWTKESGKSWITFPEYRVALAYGYKLTIIVDDEEAGCAVVMGRLKNNPFPTQKKLYDMRVAMQKAGDPREYAIKIKLSAGGFGKCVERNQDLLITTEESWAMWDDDWTFTAVSGDDELMYGYAKSTEMKRADTTANIMGAYITAYARINLHSVGMQIGYEHLLYCDTDSWKHTNSAVICPNEGNALGQWKLEQEMDYWHSTRPKQYKYHTTWDEGGKPDYWNARIKGCSLKSAAKEMGVDYEAFCEWVDLNGEITFESVIGLKESFRKEQYEAGEWVMKTKSIGA